MINYHWKETMEKLWFSIEKLFLSLSIMSCFSSGKSPLESSFQILWKISLPFSVRFKKTLSFIEKILSPLRVKIEFSGEKIPKVWIFSTSLFSLNSEISGEYKCFSFLISDEYKVSFKNYTRKIFIIITVFLVLNFFKKILKFLYKIPRIWSSCWRYNIKILSWGRSDVKIGL